MLSGCHPCATQVSVSEMKITQRDFEKLLKEKVAKDGVIYDDDTDGLGLRRRPGGSASWVFEFRLGEVKGKLTIGSAKSIPLIKAREVAKAHYGLVRDGKDPRAQKAEVVADAALTFIKTVEKFMKVRNGKVETGEAAESYVHDQNRHLNVLARSLHLLPIKGVTQPHIASLLTDVRNESGESTADHLRATLSSFFTWAAKEGLMGLQPVNPVTFTHKGEPSKRERVLKLEEMRKIWKVTEEETPFNQIVRLLMFTLQRREEIGDLDRKEVNFGDGLIVFPKERTKNKREHKLPMTEHVEAILKKRPMIVGRTLFFGLGEGGFSGWSKAKAALDERLEGMAHWTLHDLRRTGDTMMNDVLHVDPHVVEAVLNHVSGSKSGKDGVAGVYNRAEYIEKKRQALDAWSDYVIREVGKAG
jgi:integrase